MNCECCDEYQMWLYVWPSGKLDMVVGACVDMSDFIEAWAEMGIEV